MSTWNAGSWCIRECSLTNSLIDEKRATVNYFGFMGNVNIIF